MPRPPWRASRPWCRAPYWGCRDARRVRSRHPAFWSGGRESSGVGGEGEERGPLGARRGEDRDAVAVERERGVGGAAGHEVERTLGHDDRERITTVVEREGEVGLVVAARHRLEVEVHLVAGVEVSL